MQTEDGQNVKGYPCTPCIVGTWKDVYDSEKILRNNADATSEGDKLSALTQRSFLVCAYGGLIEPMNRGVQLSGDTLNLSLESWLPESSLNQYRLGNCAEVDAVNQALNSGANASDLYLYTINTKNNVSKPVCENCIYIFGDRVADVFSH